MLLAVVFSAGGGFVFGTVVGYTMKKVIILVGIIIGMFVIGLIPLIRSDRKM
ncbi:hypothetical protein [Nitrososphaera sp. AFS]|uniref:hypothetical protein n=1 Tax=Nitrososphaera sp. AFS TaxID=2301191 RepID=UPI001392372B|nr:hypothetical protein [Nitrososphaera sp. AFS]